MIHCIVCKVPVGYFDVKDGKEIITYFNVREVLFRPHVTYTQRNVSDENDKQNVIFSETIENGECSIVDDFDGTKMLIHPFVEVEAEIQSQKLAVIKVAAVASGDFVTLDENRIMGYFRDAIMRDANKKNSEASTSAADGCLQGESAGPSNSYNICNERLRKYNLSEFLSSGDVVESNDNLTDFDVGVLPFEKN